MKLDPKALELAYRTIGTGCKTCERGNDCNGFECRIAFEKAIAAYLAATAMLTAAKEGE